MLVLSILSNSPKNGVEIMDEIEATTRGWWRPSPGSVYPVLEQLSSEGLIRKRADDGRYELSERGESQLEDWPPFGHRERPKPQSVEDMFREISSYVSYFEELKSSPDEPTRRKITEQAAKIRSLMDRMSKLT